jgi:hypothetical protein
MDRAATLALARGARRLLVKAGDGILRLDAGTRPLAPRVRPGAAGGAWA